VLTNLGLVLMFLGRYEEALDRLQSGLKIAECIGDQREIGVICGNLDEVQLYRKELDRALFHQQQAHEKAVQMGSPYRTAKALVRLSRIWREMKTADALPRAAELARQAATLGAEKNLHHFEIIGRSYEAVAQAGLQQRETAIVLSRQAVEILGEHEFFDGSRPEILFNHFLVAEHDAPSEAANALRTAYEVLMSDAGRIRDPAARERFLNGIELHRAIGDAYRLA
jgi:tetratricopeptide (TPR) repeat protein